MTACLVFVVTFASARSNEGDSAKLEISGYGLLGDRELKNTLRLLEVGKTNRLSFDANFIEDAVLILQSGLARDGYLRPKISARLTLDNEEVVEYVWEEEIHEPLSRTLRARRAAFRIEEGVLFYYRNIEFRGLTAMKAENAKAFFVEARSLLPLKQTKIYTPQRLRKALSRLEEILNRKGYERATAVADSVQRNDRTGEVDVQIRVTEGLPSFVRSLVIETREGETGMTNVTTIGTNVPYSKLWVQDISQALRATNYHRGFPDASVDLTTIRREQTNNVILLDLLAVVKTGPQIHVGDIWFVGHQQTKLQVLERRVKLDPGDLLDRTKAEEGRYRLARLGVFNSVELAYETVDEETRDIVYRLKEGKRIDLSVLFGYGSYELLRGGFELEQFNVFGRAHHSRLRLVQSFKSSSADYTYTMPEFFGRDFDVFVHGSALRRKEISFTREEFGGGAGARRFFKPISSDVSLRYNYQVLSATEADVDLREGVQSAAVGAVIAEVRHDQRDNPLYPRKGYKIFSTLETATEFLGGDVNYQRMELAGSYHWPVAEGQWMHFGLSHGVVFTAGGVEKDLPFNRRFFPGGENSVRGYQQGEAAPRNEKGQIVGAETYTAVNLEFEQALTPNWSVVGFVDSIGFAKAIADYPVGETLVSVGGGIRWRTLIGPVRLEYGHNLNPRRRDPVGTLHFSLGFPF